MISDTQIQMLMRDLFFITYRVRPELLVELIPARLKPDTKSDLSGEEMAFVSAVCFRVAEVSSSVLPLPRLCFEQVNFRTYVRMGDAPAAYFFDMSVNSRLVAALTSFLRVPVHYEDIDLKTSSVGSLTDANTMLYTVSSSGLQVQATIAERQAGDPGNELPADFITDRVLGYASAGDGLFKIEVKHPRLDAVSARVESARATKLEQLGLLSPDQSASPCSALYVREALFITNPPTRVE